jgi:hypothetical protein
MEHLALKLICKASGSRILIRTPNADPDPGSRTTNRMRIQPSPHPSLKLARVLLAIPNYNY